MPESKEKRQNTTTICIGCFTHPFTMIFSIIYTTLQWEKLNVKIHNINDSLMTVKFKKYFMKNKHISEYRWHSRQK